MFIGHGINWIYPGIEFCSSFEEKKTRNKHVSLQLKVKLFLCISASLNCPTNKITIIYLQFSCKTMHVSIKNNCFILPNIQRIFIIFLYIFIYVQFNPQPPLMYSSAPNHRWCTVQHMLMYCSTSADVQFNPRWQLS